MEEKTTDALNSKIQSLMKHGVSANIEELSKIYHDDLLVMNLSIDGQFMALTKPDVLSMLKEVLKIKSQKSICGLTFII